MTHSSPKRNMISRAILMKSGLVSVNTARQANAAQSKTTVNAARPKPKAVVNAARKKVVLNAVKGNQVNVVKASTFPRKNNMYSVDLKNIVPKGGLTCLFAKATSDESKLWHRRLGHINFKTMNKLVKGNLKSSRSKVKVIRCDNGTEFKNKEMNQFCERKGIKREFSVARTPQQNGVAKRKNRTLIEAARTMLADSKLPTTFWAEAVNTACYVQNRVLVTKPHNKTPYELFLGRKPALGFMRPFGCPITILNTINHLGKFDGMNRIGVNAGDSKLMLLGINLLLLGKVNAARHKLTAAREINPTIYTSCIEQFWATINGEVQLQALVDGKKIIVTKASIRSDLQLNDEEGTDCLPNATIFKELTRMGTKTTAWNEFCSTMASAIICLAINQKFNFSKYTYLKRVGKGFSGRETPLFPTMVVQNEADIVKDNVADEAVYKERDNSLERAATTITGLDVEQDRGNINKTQSKATPNEPSSPGTSSGGNTLRSGEDRLKLQELMELCTNLQNRVIDLENTKTAQAQEITSLKLRVKKLEKKGGSRTHKLKRLYKGRYGDDIMFDVSDLAGEEVFVAEQGVSDKDVNLSVDEVTLAQALAALKTASTRPKAKGLVIHEKEQAPIVSSQQPSQAKIQDKGKAKMIEPEPVKKLSKKDQLKLDEEVAQRLQAEFDEQERIEREKVEANIALKETWDDIQAKIEADQLLAERLQAREQEELTIKERAILFQQLLEKRRKHFAAKRAEEKRNRPPTKAQQRSIMCTYLKNMEGYLVEGSSKRAGEELEQESTKKQKVDDDKETAELKQCLEIIPDEEGGKIVGIKSLLNAASITAALIDVNAAQSKLVLLENFNETYSKFNAAEGVNAASEEVSTAELVSTAYVICMRYFGNRYV
ncbi:retrovirus-related pol polyprotein from transposon TNT 1-94 [Tanacetum coccineum]